MTLQQLAQLMQQLGDRNNQQVNSIPRLQVQNQQIPQLGGQSNPILTLLKQFGSANKPMGGQMPLVNPNGTLDNSILQMMNNQQQMPSMMAQDK